MWASKLRLQKELRSGSTSGQMSAADSNSRLPRYNNRSGKNWTYSERLRGRDWHVNPRGVAKIGCFGLGIWIHGVEEDSSEQIAAIRRRGFVHLNMEGRERCHGPSAPWPDAPKTGAGKNRATPVGMTTEKSNPGGPGEPGPYKVRVLITGVWWWRLASRQAWLWWPVWGLAWLGWRLRRLVWRI